MNYPKDNRELGKSNIEQTHFVILRMLKILDIICKKYDIDYWLDYGTLLGAVRHKGFIPWDHEADIGMLRSGYEILKKNISKELPNDIFFQTIKSDPLYAPHLIIEAKLRDKYSNYTDYSLNNPTHKWHNGIQVDIFVYNFDSETPDGLTNSFERLLPQKEKLYIHKSELEYVKDMKFVDYVFPVPIGYDSYLTRLYGDYHQLPPKSEQISEYADVFEPCDHKEILYWDLK